MRLLRIETCPLWEEPNGKRTIGIYERDPHPPVVAWVNVGVFRIQGQVVVLLLNLT